MKTVGMVVCTAFIVGVVWAVVELSPLVLNSRIERIREKNLPRIVIEGGDTVYCRMKADDFRFPLPPGGRAFNPILNSGGFDTVDGAVEVRFEGTNHVSASDYETWLVGKVPIGGRVTVQRVPNGLLVKFNYFGDR